MSFAQEQTYSLGQMLLSLIICNLSRSHKLVYLGAVVTLDVYLWGLKELVVSTLMYIFCIWIALEILSDEESKNNDIEEGKGNNWIQG